MYEQMIHCDIILELLQIQRAFRTGNRTRDPWGEARPRLVLVSKARDPQTRTGPPPEKLRNQGAS